jgi:hypothetical protein
MRKAVKRSAAGKGHSVKFPGVAVEPPASVLGISESDLGFANIPSGGPNIVSFVKTNCWDHLYKKE